MKDTKNYLNFSGFNALPLRYGSLGNTVEISTGAVVEFPLYYEYLDDNTALVIPEGRRYARLYATVECEVFQGSYQGTTPPTLPSHPDILPANMWTIVPVQLTMDWIQIISRGAAGELHISFPDFD